MSIESRTDTTRTTESAGAIGGAQLGELRVAFEGNRGWRNAQNAVSQVGADDVALNRGVVNKTDHTFSHLLDDWTVTNQKMTGRCWMFA